MTDFFKYYAKNNLLTDRRLREIANLYELDTNKLLEKYNQSFLSIFKKAIRNSAFYKEFYNSHGIFEKDIKDITDIKKLPVLHKDLVRKNTDTIYLGSRFFKSIGYTSGTTGTPLNVPRSPSNVVTEQAYLRHYRLMYGYTLGQPLVSIRGMLDRNSTYKVNKQSNILYISSPNINDSTIDFYYKLIKDFNPVAVEAFPSYLYKITREMEKRDFTWNVPNAFTSSETLYDFQRERIEGMLKTKIHDWYGNGERTICLAQDKEFNYYPLPVYSINEYEKDHIITTGLTNDSFPLIRYKVDDMISVKGKDFIKNIISPEIIRIEGRAGDNINLKDGSEVGCIDHAFKGINHLEIAQVHQYGFDKPIEVKMVVDSQFGEAERKLFDMKFTNMVRNETPYIITFCRREDLTYSPSQKYKLVIKNMKAVK